MMTGDNDMDHVLTEEEIFEKYFSGVEMERIPLSERLGAATFLAVVSSLSRHNLLSSMAVTESEIAALVEDDSEEKTVRRAGLTTNKRCGMSKERRKMAALSRRRNRK